MKRILLPLALIIAAPLWAQQGTPPPLANAQLADPQLEARALALMENLRCIQCQGQSIHDSDAPIAAAMRHEVRLQVRSGKSDAEIRDWLVQRYGEWISFTPPAHGSGLVLWIMPTLLLIAAVSVARGRFRKEKK